MNKLSKKLLIVVVCIFVVQMIFGFLPASNAFAQDAAPDPKIRLNVPLPGSDYDKPGELISIDIADYIGAIYNYSLSIVGILAVLMMMAAGITWLTAGGSPDKVTNAKKMMGGAVIGLLLAFFSWTILNTINPSLTKLEVPRLPLIEGIQTKICCLGEDGETINERYGANECAEGEDKIECPLPMRDGAPCFTKRDAQACAAACQGCECVPVTKSNILSKAIAVHSFVTGVALGGVNVLGAGSINAGAASVIKASSSKLAGLTWPTIKFVLAHPIKTLTRASAATGVGAGALWIASGSDPGEPGVCMTLPKNLPNGAICDPDRPEQCASEKCLEISYLQGFGACTSGLEGNACNSSNAPCVGDLECRQGLTGLYWCVDLNKANQTGFECLANNDCQSGICSQSRQTCVTGKTGSSCGIGGVCAEGYICATDTNTCNIGSCQSQSDCLDDQWCAITGLAELEFAPNKCHDKFPQGHSCRDDVQCDIGLECSGWFNLTCESE